MKHRTFFIFSLSTVLFVLAACGGKGTFDSKTGSGDTIPMEYAANLTMIAHPKFTEVQIRNPWDTTRNLHTYILVPDSVELPEPLPQGTVVRTPLRDAIVYSSVHNSLFSEMGAIDIISGVCDATYINDPAIKARISSGIIADCGNNQAPNIEKIISLNPDAVLLSPFENSSDYGKVANIGVPIVECADYMEISPLGRAEWIKFFGLLAGYPERADSLWEATREAYLSIKNLTRNIEERPSVLTDRLYGSAWYVPCVNSTTAIYIADAGGRNPFDYLPGSGSRPLSAEQVLMKAADSEVWLIRYHQATDKTMAELAADDPVYRRFDAFSYNKVYGCNTSHINFYEETPFHPQWYLANLVALLHPELVDSLPEPHSYYTPLK